MVKLVITLSGAEEKNVCMELVKQYAEICNGKSLETTIDMKSAVQEVGPEQREIEIPAFLQRGKKDGGTI